MADGIDNLQICPPWPESCDVAAIPLRPDPAYGMGAAGSSPMPLFPPIDLSPPGGNDGCLLSLLLLPLGVGGGDSFDCMSDDEFIDGSIWAAEAFGGPWEDQTMFIGIIETAYFENFPTGTPISGGGGGWTWGSAWVDVTMEVGFVATDTLDTYPPVSDVAGLDDGVGFSDPWVDVTFSA